MSRGICLAQALAIKQAIEDAAVLYWESIDVKSETAT